MITKQNFCEVTLRLSTASESRTKTYDAPCRIMNQAQILQPYSSLSNKRAGWNKRAGRKFCPILGNFESVNACRVDLSHF